MTNKDAYRVRKTARLALRLTPAAKDWVALCRTPFSTVIEYLLTGGWKLHQEQIHMLQVSEIPKSKNFELRLTPEAKAWLMSQDYKAADMLNYLALGLWKIEKHDGTFL
ncbi:MAG: hypothetical protein AAGI66_06225 [Cyanobacteria bacterium P01_H01_bin.74]